MIINDKDRSQLLRMAGNIVCGLVQVLTNYDEDKVSILAASLAYKTMCQVDQLIQEHNKNENTNI